MDAVILGRATFESLAADGSLRIDGDAAAFAAFLGLMDTFEFWFDIVTP